MFDACALERSKGAKTKVNQFENSGDELSVKKSRKFSSRVHLKSEGAEEEEQNMGNVQVFVQDQDDKTTEFNLGNTEEMQKMTVLQLKELIYEKEGIPVDQQQLIFQGQQMEDSELLSERDVQHKSTIHLSRRLCGRGAEEEEQTMGNIRFSIKQPFYKKCRIDLSSRELRKMTVLQLKKMIFKREGIPVDKQRIMVDHCQMKDSALLSECRFHPESPCVQDPQEQEQNMENITVFLKNLTGETTEYNLGNTEEMQKMTVLQLKELIYEKEGIPVDKQRLIFGSWPMKNSALLSKYKVRHGSAIHQAGRPCVQGAEEQEQKMKNIKIFARSMFGRMIEYNLGNTEEMQKMTVLRLKELISDKEGIPEAQQRLIFNGWQLRESELLCEYGVQHGTVLHLSLMLRGGGEFRGSIEILVDFLELQESELSV